MIPKSGVTLSTMENIVINLGTFWLVVSHPACLCLRQKCNKPVRNHVHMLDICKAFLQCECGHVFPMLMVMEIASRTACTGIHLPMLLDGDFYQSEQWPA